MHTNIQSFIRVPDVTVYLGMLLKSQLVSPCTNQLKLSFLNLVLEISLQKNQERPHQQKFSLALSGRREGEARVPDSPASPGFPYMWVPELRNTKPDGSAGLVESPARAL